MRPGEQEVGPARLPVCLSARVFASEFVDSPGGVEDLLLTGVKGVAGGADLDVHLLPHGGPGRKLVTAATDHLDVGVLGVDSFFHDNPGIGPNRALKNRWNAVAYNPGATPATVL
jgi:hypothetical protein